MDVLKFLFALSALVVCTLADCGPDGLQCCLSEFLPLVSPAGFKLAEQSLSAACTIRDQTILCMEDYSDQCVPGGNEKLEEAIKKTKGFIDSACSPTADFMKGVKEYEGCFRNSSESLQSCYNKTLLPEAASDDHSKWRAECCSYKELRNCALQTIEASCGAKAVQLIQEEVVNVNGAGLELACLDVFRECENAATTLASSLILVSLYSITKFLRFL